MGVRECYVDNLLRLRLYPRKRYRVNMPRYSDPERLEYGLFRLLS